MKPLMLLTVAIAIVEGIPIADAQDDTPNIVIVLADDLGWGDPRCYQADSKIPTPAMDRLATEGIRFTDAHTPSSVCTPTRYTLLTGRYAWRTRLKSGVLDGFDPPLIGQDEDTLASLLKRVGYRTHCVGKWHLGLQWTRKDGSPVEDRDVSKGFRHGADIDYETAFRGGPTDVGFDTYFGISASLDMSPYCFLRRDRVETVPTLLTEENRDGMFLNQVAGVTTKDFQLVNVLPRIGVEAVKIIRDSKDDAIPFFCYVPLTSPHLPVVPTPDSRGKSRAGSYGDFVVATDSVLGDILSALDDTGQADNTLVLFTSDNGGLFHWWDFRADDDGGTAPKTPRGEHLRQFSHQSNADWRGTKADIYEGGHRVPFLLRWPNRTEAGRTVDTTVELTDVFATIADIVGTSGTATSGMDSFSMLPIIDSRATTFVRPFAIHHSLAGTFAVRHGDWKLVAGRGSGGFTKPRTLPESEPAGQLYNLQSDIQETSNQYLKQPAIVMQLSQILTQVQATSARQVATTLDQDRARASNVTQLVAHRGASAERPECTLAAVRRAIEVGATAVEVDVRTSKDGELFILHDATLDRTTNGKGLANELTLAQLQQLDAGSSFDPAYQGARIPSLIEVAELCLGKIDILLDLKEQGDEYDTKVAQVIREHFDPAQTIVGARSVAQAKRFRELLPQAKQLALVPAVDDIEAFSEAGVDCIRIWPQWLDNNDEPVKRVRATGKRLHLNGTTGSLVETLSLLTHAPDSLSSDDPRRQKDSLLRIAAGDLPQQQLQGLIDVAKGTRLESRASGARTLTFLNRDYRMIELPDELDGLPRYVFDGGSGAQVSLRFRQPAVVFAAFEYNASGAWSFGDGRSPHEHGWHVWRSHAYRGSSNPDVDGQPNRASIWFREFKAGQTLYGLPSWWLCLGIVDLETARNIKGFTAGLVSTATPTPHFSHADLAARIRPLKVPLFETADSIREWQTQQRKLFIKRMVFPYEGTISADPGLVSESTLYSQQEFHVTIEGERLFRYFRLQPKNIPLSNKYPAVICFMGHGKVQQVLQEQDSYQHACAAEFAKAGYLVFVMENIGMESGTDTHLDLDRLHRLEGYGWYSLLFAHQRMLLDRVFSDPNVDSQRVGVTGVSTGGLLALSAAAMDTRVAAASVQGIFGSMRVSFIRDRNQHCSCGAIPGLLPEFDLPELALLVAPRPLHVSNGTADGFAPQEAERCLRQIEPIYQQAGGQAPQFTISPGGHAFSFKPALKFFQFHLR
ncbi:MAG: sulfatase-like hydrolase/transferase [Planctomycetaceae bacterium]|nr:sulfatase-like hydrolase/transferase [Planctomycetales bacterium]MCB9936860.1 sulfatase-like hydrolase/transferase [Planctomycetaceae bacterium]